MSGEYNAQMLETIKKQLKKFPLNPVRPSQQDSGSLAAVMVVLHGDQDDPEHRHPLGAATRHLREQAGGVHRPQAVA